MWGREKNIVYLALAAFFVTNAILGEVTGGKLFTFGPFTMSIGVIPWPCFISAIRSSTASSGWKRPIV